MLTHATVADVEAFLPTVMPRNYPPMSPVTYDGLVEHIGAGPARAWRAAPSGPPVLLAGIKRFPALPSVAWFCAARPLGRQLLPACLALRAEFVREMEHHERGIVVQTRVGNVDGRRLARAMGFVLLAENDGVMIWGFAAWNWQQSQHSLARACRSQTPSNSAAP